MTEPKRFLVTGSGGFVGSRLRAALLNTFPGASVFDLGNDDGQGRLESHEDVEQAAQKKPDIVFHLAASSSVEQSIGGAADTMRANLVGTINLAEAIRKLAPGATFVFASSGEVYGSSFVDRGSVSEGDPLQPNTPYARSKAAGEWAVRDLLSDVCAVISLRLFNHTGKGQDERFVLPSFAGQIARIEAGLSEATLKVGNLAAQRDFLHVDDVIDAYIAIASDPPVSAQGFEAYNVASGVPRTIGDLLANLVKLAKTEIAIEVDPSRLRPSDIPKAVGNNAKFKAKWGWQPKKNVRQILADLLASARDSLAIT